MRILTQIYYTADNYHIQLKKARLYRGYTKQATICLAMDVSKQVWSFWELGKRKPPMSQMIFIANLLELDLNFFFKKEVEPEDYDLKIV